MKNSFSLGLASGMASLAIGVPLLATLAGAQTAVSDADTASERPVPSQECVLALVNAENARLAGFDAHSAERKADLIARIDALKAAANIADDEARSEALKALHEAMKDRHLEESEEIQALREAVQSACGDSFGRGPGGHGPMGGKIAELLGMSKEELKAAIESGKTIEELAQEKGVELPPRPERGERRGTGRHGRGFGGLGGLNEGSGNDQ